MCAFDAGGFCCQGCWCQMAAVKIFCWWGVCWRNFGGWDAAKKNRFPIEGFSVRHQVAKLEETWALLFPNHVGPGQALNKAANGTNCDAIDVHGTPLSTLVSQSAFACCSSYPGSMLCQIRADTENLNYHRSLAYHWLLSRPSWFFWKALLALRETIFNAGQTLFASSRWLEVSWAVWSATGYRFF